MKRTTEMISEIEEQLFLAKLALKKAIERVAPIEMESALIEIEELESQLESLHIMN